MYARHASRFSMRAGGGSVLAPEAGWFAVAGPDRVETCITGGAELAHDQSPQRLATNKLTTAKPDTFNFDPSLAHPIRDGWVQPKLAARLPARVNCRPSGQRTGHAVRSSGNSDNPRPAVEHTQHAGPTVAQEGTAPKIRVAAVALPATIREERHSQPLRISM